MMQTDTTQEIINRYGGLRVAQDDELSLYSDDSVFQEPKSAKIAPLKKPLRVPQASPLRHSYSDLSVDRDMDSFIRRPVRAPAGDAKTDFMIRETHKLVNEVPSSILQTKEGEEYQRMLSNSISKLIHKYEELAHENETLKSSSDKIKINFLNDKLNKLSKDNRELKSELRDMSEDYTKILNDNTQVRAENELLRAKLIKYKKLYEEQQKAPKAAAAAPKESKDDLMGAIEQLLQQRQPRGQEEPKADLMHKFEEIANNIGKQPDVDLQQLLSKNNELYGKLLSVLENNGASVRPASEQEENKPGESRGDAKDLVVKCIMCCPGVNEGAKKKCKRCSTVGSEMSDKDHTLELMGEYKWSL